MSTTVSDEELRFVPRDSVTGVRYEMRLSTEDRAKYRALPHRARRWIEITDQNSGLLYLVRRASCGSGCYCDAVAKPLVLVKEG